MGTSNFNARVVLETQELLRQEQRRKEQEANKARSLSTQETSSTITQEPKRDQTPVAAPVQTPPHPKGPYRQDVPPSPSQLAKLSRVRGFDKGRQFYSWINDKEVNILVLQDLDHGGSNVLIKPDKQGI